jgi:release factor glutamine methyltransferase
VVAWATDDLRSRGSSSPRLDVELLLGLVLKLDRVQLIVDADRPLSKDELAAYRALHRRRRAGEPVAYLRGVREFYGRNFRVDARVLVPRPETEILVETALRRTRALSLSARVLDLCTGSGCVAITLARERPTTRVVAVDLSEGALVVARENATRLGVTHQIALLRSDLYAALDPGARFDLITANPPYISELEIPSLPPDVRDFEPRLALAGGEDGLAVVRRVVLGARSFLAPGGVLALEVGAGQAPEVQALFEQGGFTAIERQRDYAGHERVVSGQSSG